MSIDETKYESIIFDTKQILDNENFKSKWQQKFTEFLDLINKKEKTVFSPNPPIISPLFLYTSISTPKAKSFIRYKGQTIGTLVFTRNRYYLKINKTEEKRNKKYFDLSIKCGKYDWDGKEADKFRTHFATNPIKNNNPEATVESAIISALESKRKYNEINVHAQCSAKVYKVSNIFSIYSTNFLYL